MRRSYKNQAYYRFKNIALLKKKIFSKYIKQYQLKKENNNNNNIKNPNADSYNNNNNNLKQHEVLTLTIASWNAGSIGSHYSSNHTIPTVGANLEKLGLLTRQLDAEQIDLIGIQETWLPSHEGFFNQTNYVYHSSIPGRKSINDNRTVGGHCVGARADSKYQFINEKTESKYKSSVEALWSSCKLPNTGNKLYIAFVYVPHPSAIIGELNIESFINKVTQLIENNNEVILIGDFNADITSKEWIKISSRNKKPKSKIHYSLIYQLTTTLGLSIINNSNDYTHYAGGSNRETTIDLCLATHGVKDLINLSVIPMTKTGHKMIISRINFPYKFKYYLDTPRNQVISNCKTLVNSYKFGDQQDIDKINQFFDETTEDTPSETIISVSKKFYLYKRDTKVKDILLTKLTEARHNRKISIQLLHKAKSGLTIRNAMKSLHTNISTINSILNQIQELEKAKIRSSHQNAIEMALQNSSTNSLKRLYQKVRLDLTKSQGSKRLDIGSLPLEQKEAHYNYWKSIWGRSLHDLTHHNEVYDWLDKLKSRKCLGVTKFNNICKRSVKFNHNLCYQHQSQLITAPWKQCQYPTFSFVRKKDGTIWECTENEIINAINKMKWGKASGPSGVSTDAFKISGRSIITQLNDIFNSILTNLTRPSRWNDSSLILLHKKGSRDPPNFRPINLTESEFRICERVIYERMKDWYENVISHNQGGFRKGRGTSEQLFVLLTMSETAIHKNKQLYIAALDIKKAFDSCPHDSLVYSFARAGLDIYSCKILLSLLSDHTSICGVNENSINIELTNGVLQGGLLSPIEFNLFADEGISTDIENSFGSTILSDTFPIAACIYADDSTLIADNNSNLQKIVSYFHSIMYNKRAEIHIGKSLQLTINKLNNQHNHDSISINNELIDEADSIEILGITLFSNGTMSRKTSRSNSVLRTLCNTWRNVQNTVSTDFASRLLHTHVIPIVTYGSLVSTLPIKINRLSTDFARIVTNSPRHVSNNALMEFFWMV